MKKEAIRQIIADFQARDFSYVKKRNILIPENIDKVITISGSRRCGKTHLMFYMINELRDRVNPENILYINFEDDRLFPVRINDLSEILETYFVMFPETRDQKKYFFFDEIQLVENWEVFIRRVYDNENCRIFISGSSSKLLGQEIASSLRGRSFNIEVFPLSFAEYLQFKNIAPENDTSKNISLLKKTFRDYMLTGGFPETIMIGDFYIRKLLQEYIDLVIYKDIIERYRIREKFFMKYLVNHCFRHVSTLLSINKLFRDFKSQGFQVSRNTVFEYLEHLQDTCSVFLMPLHSHSYREQQRNPRKIYIVDNGFNYAVNIKPDLGRLLENIVFLHLRRKTRNICYYNDVQEVDFYIEEENELINVCYNLDDIAAREREVKGLINAMNKIGLQKATIVTMDESEDIQANGKKITVIPAWKYLSGME